MNEIAEQTVKGAQFARPRYREVYVMESSGLCKVGYTYNAKVRLRSIRSALPQPVRLVRAFLAWRLSAHKVEKEAHRLLAEHRVRGEWFNVTPERACAAVEEALNFIYWRGNRP
jgi:hypothetical protein